MSKQKQNKHFSLFDLLPRLLEFLMIINLELISINQICKCYCVTDKKQTADRIAESKQTADLLN